NMVVCPLNDFLCLTSTYSPSDSESGKNLHYYENYDSGGSNDSANPSTCNDPVHLLAMEKCIQAAKVMKNLRAQIKSLKMNVHHVDTDKDVEYIKKELQNMREINGKLNDQLTSSFTHEKEVELQSALARTVILENGLKTFKQASSEKDQ
ncbi:Unknown protein, partial [Striga hermonthica]